MYSKFKILLTCFICLVGLPLLGQMHNGNYGHEWINYTQSYYKIKVWKDGIHRIPKQTLVNGGIQLSNLQANQLQLFVRGQEVPIYVQVNNNEIEYIEFYGEKNKGQVENNFYPKPQWHFNPEYSLVNDTAAYFLTWNNSNNNLRFNNRSADLTNLPAIENNCLFTATTLASTSNYVQGKTYTVSGEVLYKSIYEFGEGYGSSASINQTLNVSTPNLAQGNAQVELRAYGIGYIPHTAQLSVGNNIVNTMNFIGDSVFTISANINTNLLTNGNNTLRLRGMEGNTDLYNIAFAKIHYPRTFNFGGLGSFQFKLQGNAGIRRYIELNNIDNTNASLNQMYIYDLANYVRIQGFWDGSKLRCDIPAGNQVPVLHFANLASSNNLTTIARIESVTFRDYTIPQGDYIIISNSRLYSDAQGNNPVYAYAAYRASTGYSPIVLDINDIYNQFGYGIDYSPLALRNLSNFLANNWANVKYLFIIGKGRTMRNMRNGIASNLFIPTWGNPPSDNVMVANHNTDIPSIPVGRLAATSGEQVRTYLRKITEVENQHNTPQTLANRNWMKNILHLGGGRNNLEQNLIRTHLNTLKDIAERPRYGANVESFFKTSTSPIQAAQSAYLDSLINNGVSLITFFGHSSANSFDFNLDYPSNYTNREKYPMIMALGCYGGTIYEADMLISEEFIFEPHAGAVVFLASVSASALGSLHEFAHRFYFHKGGDYYGEGAGILVQKAIETLQSSSLYSTTTQLVTQTMCFHGDPAFALNAKKRPDYYIDPSLISTTPNNVTTQLSNFNLVIDMRNLGEALDTLFWVSVTRELPDGTRSIVARQQVQAPFAQRTITIPIPVGGLNSLGTNKFTIKIDADDEIPEAPLPAAEENNIVQDFIIRIVSDAILPIYPSEFAIVPNQPIILRASTGNVLAPSQRYVFQIDTTEYYNSPLLKTTQITQAGGVVEWTPNQTYLDNTVYYWRVSPDSTSPESGYQWAKTSFIYMNGEYPGWNQSHFFQYHRDQIRNMELVEGVRKFNYISSVQELLIRNGFTPNPLMNENLATYLNGNRIDKCNCPYNSGVFVQVIDDNTGEVWTLPDGNGRYGAINCDLGGRATTLLLFQTNAANPTMAQQNQAYLLAFLRDSIPNGHYVNFFTLNNAGAHTWSSDLKNFLLSQGADATRINTLASTHLGLPYIFFFKKGSMAYQYNKDTLGLDNTSSVIELSGLMEGSWTTGDLTSTIIGPVNNWTHLHWNAASWETIPTLTDTVSINLYGLDAAQTTPYFLGTVQGFDTTLTWIDAQQFPYLQMVWQSKDAINSTAPHLNYWRITADMAPEAALRPELHFTKSRDTLDRGNPFTIAMAMQNISTVDMDSMLVKFQVLGTNIIEYKRLAPLTSGDTLIANFTLSNTADLEGAYQLLIEINPDNDQRELYHFNNIALISFYINKDLINPLLDVTFDGMHIFNGDIVSAKPEIIIQLSDENKYLALNNPDDFTILLKNPTFPNGEMQLTTANTDIIFYPADESNLARENKARMHLKPHFVTDGKYTMYVSAKDRSNNNAGNISYSVDFEVINKPSISNVLNYPNPFTTSTQFVFTLTGESLPDDLMIQIYTISGKVVREIKMAELGPIRIGHNKTEFAWDGTDMYGDRLANGVYLYRVVAQKNGNNMEAYRNNRIDYMFKDGFGKMYLMR